MSDVLPSGEIEISFEGMSVCIAIPSYNEQVPIDLAVALIEAVSNLRLKGVKVAIATERGNALIDLARSRLATKFIDKTTYQKIFWIDDDIIFDPADFERLLAWSTMYPIVAATYPARMEPAKFFIRRESEKWDQNQYGLFKVIGCGMGFCVMDRSVFEKLLPTTETFIIADEEIHRFFKMEYKDGRYFGEDICFLNNWHENHEGFVMLDSAINLKHVGTKQYDYKFSDYIMGVCNE